MIIGVFNQLVWSVVVIAGEFILLLFIEIMADGCRSELRGGCFMEVYRFYVEINQVDLVWLLPRCWLFFEGLLIEVLLYFSVL